MIPLRFLRLIKTRIEKRSPYVKVAKFLDDNKPKNM